MDDGIRCSEATIVMATYDLNRWPLLATAVESLLTQSVHTQQITICVDQNTELYGRIQKTWPEITAVLNTGERGASNSRNIGAKLAKTPFIVFVDDDIRVRPGWLSRLLEPFADPAVVGTGGGVIASWPTGGRPGWFPLEFDWVVGASYRGMPEAKTTVRNVWAENMAVRTQVFNFVGGFRSGFGKVGSLSRPEDTELCIRMAATAADAKWIYVPGALVEHHVPVRRATFPFFLRRNYLEGAGKLEMVRLLGRNEKLATERDYLRRTLPSGIFRGLWSAIRHGNMNGLRTAGAIVVGILAAGVGIVAEVVRG